MSYYFRKSFRLGPVRLNVSKSGLGVSTGVRGLRYGIRPDGRTYIHAGRYGMYYRATSARPAQSGSRGQRAASESRATGVSPMPGDSDVPESARFVPRGRDEHGRSRPWHPGCGSGEQRADDVL